MTKRERDHIISENVRATTEFIRGWRPQPTPIVAALPSPAKTKPAKRRYCSILAQPREKSPDDLLSVEEVGHELGMSRDTVIRYFENLPGVVYYGHEETRQKRGYWKRKIRRWAVEKFIKDHTRKHR